MATETQTEAKTVRKRKNKTKRWTPKEERLLVEYLLANQPIEKPYAEAFYSRFGQEAKVLADWKLIRTKVWNMKARYVKAKEWKESKEAAGFDAVLLKRELLKMFRFYDEFEEIYWNKEHETPNEECYEATSVSNEAIAHIMKLQMKMILLQKQKMTHDKLAAEKELAMKEQEITLKEKEFELKENEFESQEKQKILELRKRERLAMEQLKIKYKNKI